MHSIGQTIKDMDKDMAPTGCKSHYIQTTYSLYNYVGPIYICTGR